MTLKANSDYVSKNLQVDFCNGDTCVSCEEEPPYSDWSHIIRRYMTYSVGRVFNHNARNKYHVSRVSVLLNPRT